VWRLLAIASFFSIKYSDKINTIDIVLLAYDLPINSYLDNEFDTWLDF